MEKPTKDHFLNHRDAAAHLGLSPGTLYIKVSQGEVPVYKIKGCHLNRYKLADLENLIQPKQR